MNRTEIATLIVARLAASRENLSRDMAAAGRVGSAFVDDLLPDALAREIHDRFPPTDKMVLKRSIKEHKRVAAQMDRYDPLLEEAVYAFQDPRVADVVGNIMVLKALEPDPELYAGGISLMTRGGYLRPHLTIPTMESGPATGCSISYITSRRAGAKTGEDRCNCGTMVHSPRRARSPAHSTALCS